MSAPRSIIGRPTIYTEELAIKICDTIATSPLSVEKLAELHDWFPHPDTVYDWIHKKPGFSELYARAKENQVEVRQEHAIDLVTDESKDFIIDPNGKHIINNAAMQRLRLHVELLKWQAERLKSKKYGAKAQAEVLFDDDQLQAIKQQVLAQKINNE